MLIPWLRVCSDNLFDPVNIWVDSGVVSIVVLLCTPLPPAYKARDNPSVISLPFSFLYKSSATVTLASIVSSVSIPCTKWHCRVEIVLGTVWTHVIRLNHERRVFKDFWVSVSFSWIFSGFQGSCCPPATNISVFCRGRHISLVFFW